MQYNDLPANEFTPLTVLEESEYSPNKLAFRDDSTAIWLYHADCTEFMDLLLAKS